MRRMRTFAPMPWCLKRRSIAYTTKNPDTKKKVSTENLFIAEKGKGEGGGGGKNKHGQRIGFGLGFGFEFRSDIKLQSSNLNSGERRFLRERKRERGR